MFENNTEISLNIIKTVYSKRKFLITLLIGSIIAAVAFTFLTPKKYKAMGTVYPVNSNAYNDIVYNPTFGKEIDADRLIQLFRSNFVTDSIIKEFNLIEYYEIDTAKPSALFTLYKKYNNDIGFSRTRYLSVIIQATTKDAELSANIVNRLISLIDSEREKILKTNVKLITENYQKEYNLKRKKVENLLDQIYNLSNKKGSSKQNPLFKNREIFMEERQKNTHIFPGDAGIKKIAKTNQTQEIESLINDYYFMQGRMNFTRQKLDEARTKLNQPIPSVYKVSFAKAIHKKVSPSLFVNLTLFVSITFILSLLLIIGLEQLKRLKSEIKK